MITINPIFYMEVLLCSKKIIVSSMALTMFGGAATMLEAPTAQAASYNSTSSSYFDVTPEEYRDFLSISRL